MKEVAQHVLKPLLEKHISNTIRILYSLPEKWFIKDNETSEIAKELITYFKKIKFKVPNNFIIDLEDRL